MAGKNQETNVIVAEEVTSLLEQSEKGKVTIADHVVAKIAGLAVREVEGVRGLLPVGTGQVITNLANSIRGGDSRDLGVRVEVGKVECAVDVRIVLEYGASIPKVADAIRVSVGNRIKSMTGLVCKEINVEVVDLWFAEDHVDVPVARRVQ
ncbi:MAG: Asp23/Gls24 family envelope stress response protein [Deltaproteobacteria bacterium]|nr:Asp23/Gls24 family envelope stress response protein [Deltaproteobacteria bacterium]